jgi:hypothetical protein
MVTFAAMRTNVFLALVTCVIAASCSSNGGRQTAGSTGGEGGDGTGGTTGGSPGTGGALPTGGTSGGGAGSGGSTGGTSGPDTGGSGGATGGSGGATGGSGTGGSVADASAGAPDGSGASGGTTGIGCTGVMAAFCDDFEAQTVGMPPKGAGFTTKVSGGAMFSIDTSKAYSGTKSAHVHVPQGTGGNTDPTGQMVFNSQFPVMNNDLHGRVMVYLTKNPNDSGKPNIHWD